MNKILVSDYDNTFYLNDEDIERNKKAVQKFRKKGNLFVLATGRSYIDIKSKIDKYNIEYDYLIINHGATIIGENEEVLYNFSIKDSIISDIKLDLELDNIEYLNNKPEKSKDKIYFCCRMLESRLNFENEKLTKIAVKYDDSVDVSRINKKISDKYQDVNSYHVSKNMIEIISKDINKSKAIKLLADYYKLNDSSIFTIGDGYNDISMVKDYNGYAMENSVQELKEVSIKIIKSVSDLINEIIEL